MTPSTFPHLARWTAWANDRLYAACGQLAPEAYFAQRPCAFGSIHATLNHLLATDRVWLGRLTGEGHDIPSLDHIVCADFASLAQARRAEDERLARVVGEIAETRDLDGDLVFVGLGGGPQRSTPLRVVLSHLFLHHAHHRGQVHALLSQTEVAPPALDLMYFPLPGH